MRNAIIEDGIYSWEFRNRFGRLVSAQNVSEYLIKSANELDLIHLRPTYQLGLNEKIFGQCKVYSPSINHFYQSSPFYMDVRRSDVEARPAQCMFQIHDNLDFVLTQININHLILSIRLILNFIIRMFILLYFIVYWFKSNEFCV